jgi:hypothetical protein
VAETRSSLCPGNNLRCPNPDCGRPLGTPLFHARNGDGFLVCPHNVGSYTTRRRCNQYVFWYCTNHLCTVLAIRREDYERVREMDTVEEILAALGMAVVEAA